MRTKPGGSSVPENSANKCRFVEVVSNYQGMLEKGPPTDMPGVLRGPLIETEHVEKGIAGVGTMRSTASQGSLP